MPAPELTVYPARLVRTMDPARPTAAAVAVVGDRVRAVGSIEELSGYGVARVDDRYADAVLFPGFVEAHTHVMSGGMWEHTYVGYFERMSPDGRRWEGCTSIEAAWNACAQRRRRCPRRTSPCSPGAWTRSTSRPNGSTGATSTRCPRRDRS